MITIFTSEEEFLQDEFNAFCQNNNFKFPDNYIKFIRENNDGQLDINVVEGFEECSIRYFYGTTTETYSNIDDVFECFKGRMPYQCIPIADTEGGNQVCISLEPGTYGKIYFWNHETMDVDNDESCEYVIKDMPLIANNFEELISKIISVNTLTQKI